MTERHAQLVESLENSLRRYREGRMDPSDLADAVEIALASDRLPVPAFGRALGECDFPAAAGSQEPAGAARAVHRCGECGTPIEAPSGACVACPECGRSETCS